MRDRRAEAHRAAVRRLGTPGLRGRMYEGSRAFQAARHMEDTRSTLLIRLADRSDQQAWQSFDQLYRPMLVGYARSRGLDGADAEDVAQQCVASVLDHIKDYQHVGRFRSWLRTVAENKIRDLYRGRRERQAGSAVWAAQPDSQPSPEQVWERLWLAEHLRFCLENVRPDIAEHTYQAFYQNVIEQRPAKEIAERLGISVNQVYVAKFRVLERIRTLLADLTGSDLARIPT